jgi:hypothetical protein
LRNKCTETLSRMKRDENEKIIEIKLFMNLGDYKQKY